MLAVARPPKSERSPRQSRTFRLPQDLLEALEALAEKNRRAVTTELEIAAEQYLASQELWPPVSKSKSK